MPKNSCISKFGRMIFIVLFSGISAFTLTGQEKKQSMGRGGEIYPYPYSHFAFIQPRFDRQNLLGGDYFNTYAIRAVKTFGGSYHLRLDLPMASTNTSGEDVFGLSDSKIRFLHASPIVDHWYLGYGVEMTLPTATDKSLGSGKWQARPELGVEYFFGQPNHTTGTFILGVDYRFNFAGQSERSDISVLSISPNIDYWGDKWYIGYYATWSYDFINHYWDIPLDVEFGYAILPKITLAVEFIQPLLKKRTYNNEYAIKLKYAF